jgi:hypothetical protein
MGAERDGSGLSAKGWLAVSTDQFDAGECLLRDGLRRGAVSRFYYAAYSACQAIALHFDPSILSRQHRNVPHRDLPGEMHRRLARVPGIQLFRRNLLRTSLVSAAGLRIDADYRPQAEIDDRATDIAKRAAAEWRRVARKVVGS